MKKLFIKLKIWFQRLFSNIKNWFHLNKEFIRKWFILLFVFFFGMGVGGCTESLLSINRASAKEISDINVIDDNVFAFNLGDINQTFFRRNTGGVDNEVLTSASVPMFVQVEWSSNEYPTPNFSIGFGQYNNPITNYKKNFRPYTNLSPNDSEYRDFDYTYSVEYDFLSMDVPNSVRYSPTINANGYVFGTNSRLYKFDTMNSMYIKGTSDYSTYNGLAFGYCLPRTYDFTLTGSNGQANIDYMRHRFDSETEQAYYQYFYANNASTFFLLGGNFVTDEIDRLMSYNITYHTINSSVISEFTVTLSTLCIHSFVFNDGNTFSFGYSVPTRYYPTPSATYDNVTYYLNSYTITPDYEDAFKAGEQKGYNDAVRDLTDEIGRQEWQKGYDKGFDDGEQKGLSTSLEDVSPFNALVTFVNGFFSIRLFGDLTLGTLLSISLGIILLGVIIKVFMGG